METRENIQEILEKIKESEYVLVGLGEHFDMHYFLSMQAGYMEIIQKLQENHALWLRPYLDSCYRKQFAPKLEEEMTKGLQNLADILEKKSYFVVSSSTNHTLREIPWKKLLLKKERYVNPCGEWNKLQCPNGCPEGLLPVTDNEETILRDWYQNMKKGDFRIPDLGKCPNCGKKLILNNIYAEHYDENGYMENWTDYHNWLQNTWNHNLVILEIGEGTRFPSIIKNPFERIAQFQQKAEIYRNNEEQNPIAWLLALC